MEVASIARSLQLESLETKGIQQILQSSQHPQATFQSDRSILSPINQDLKRDQGISFLKNLKTITRARKGMILSMMKMKRMSINQMKKMTFLFEP